jgi:DNA-binding beta-propeller fold protein YncE
LSDDVSQYDTDAVGLLSPLSAPAVATGDFPAGLAVSPDGTSVYVVNEGSFDLSQYDVGAAGELSPKTPAKVAGVAPPFGVAVNPDGKSVYVTDLGAVDAVSQFDVGPDGALLPKDPATVPAGALPLGVAVRPDGRNVYVTNQVGDTVSQYAVGASGLLEPLSPPTVPAGDNPIGVAVSPDGESVYVANSARVASSAGTVLQYDVGAGGTLSPKSPATVAAGALPSEVAVSPDGESVYVTNDAAVNPSVSQYYVGAGGTLSPKSPATVGTGSGPIGIAVSPAGTSVYVTNFGSPFTSGSVSQYDVGAGGTLSPKSPATVAAGAGPAAVVVSPPPRVPTSKEQCKNGGWRNFAQFKNQGQCIALVNHGS